MILSISVKNHSTRKQHATNCVDERSLKTAESKTSRGVCDKEEEIVEEEVEVGEWLSFDGEYITSLSSKPVLATESVWLILSYYSIKQTCITCLEIYLQFIMYALTIIAKPNRLLWIEINCLVTKY